MDTLDLSGKKLKKLNKPTHSEAQVTTLILDDNELQRLDNIDSFIKVQKLSVVRNQLLRMYGVCRLHSLHTLNLAQNGILTIEGIKELVNLKYFCLAGNNIKTIEHLNTNVNLESLDLSENNITHITDLSHLKNLKELLLHGNKIGHLHQCDRYLPTSLTTLTLASNNINDLNEVSQLVNLVNLTSISVSNNPCVSMTGNVNGFDYRPFIINWCMNVRVIDGYIVDAIESLRAEWLYSQGRGRHFRIGDQNELSQYLATVCPLTGETLETEEDRKLRLILSKAKHHQQQLRDQEINADTPSPSPVTKKKLQGSKNSPRLNSSRLSSRLKSPDRMSSSCCLNSSAINSPLMSQSLDPTMLNQDINLKCDFIGENQRQIDSAAKCFEGINSPLQALSKLVPVPESLMSPDYHPNKMSCTALEKPSEINQNLCNKTNNQFIRTPKPSRIATAKSKSVGNITKNNNHSPSLQRKIAQNAQNKKSEHSLQSVMRKSSSSEDESEICQAKLQNIQMKIEEHKQQKDVELRSSEKIEQAAIYIQKMWRGYYIRNKNKRVQEVFKMIQSQRAEEYIQKLANDMESTKVALESERRIQMLQMQAINALWKKVATMQPEGENPSVVLNSSLVLEDKDVIKGLAQTCNMLHTQIQQLQGSMQDILRFMTLFTQSSTINQQNKENVISTQTEISAVHTPQGEGAKLFPFQKQSRPSSLPLPVNQKNVTSNELKQFAGSLVDGVIKTVSEIKNDTAEECTEDIIFTTESQISTNTMENDKTVQE